MIAHIVAGAIFPDFELTDHTGKRRKLSDLQGPDPMVLVLSRGGYCRKDLRQAEQKAAWEQGEHDRFYPYGKTYGQVFREQT